MQYIDTHISIIIKLLYTNAKSAQYYVHFIFLCAFLPHSISNAIRLTLLLLLFHLLLIFLLFLCTTQFKIKRNSLLSFSKHIIISFRCIHTQIIIVYIVIVLAKNTHSARLIVLVTAAVIK